MAFLRKTLDFSLAIDYAIAVMQQNDNSDDEMNPCKNYKEALESAVINAITKEDPKNVSVVEAD